MLKEIEVDQVTTILQQYGWSGRYQSVDMESGMNNTTKRIIINGQHYMLRIYDNHQDSEIVEVEHRMLIALHHSSPGIQVPQVVLTSAGGTYTYTEQGKLAALYHFIAGNRPRAGYVNHIASLGRAAALLNKQMAAITLPCSPQYEPYYLLADSYHSLLQTDLYTYFLQEDETLASRAADLSFIMRELEQTIHRCNQVQHLPKQWIHGDIVCQNAVANGEHIIGILDFEFVAEDLRAMEPAVMAVDLLQRENWLNDCPSAAIAVMMEEYLQVVPLQEEEVNAILLLMKLRILDVLLHVVTRYQAAISPLSLLVHIIDSTAINLRELNDNAALQAIFNSREEM